MTWQSRTLGTTTFSSVACAGPERCFAFGLGGAYATSTDGGASWSLSYLAATAHRTVVTASCAATGACIALANEGPEVPRSGEYRGVILFSRDAGQSWSLATVRGAAVELLGGLACPTASSCYATATTLSRSARRPGLLLASTDGGAVWSRLSAAPPGLVGPLACSSAAHCVAAGGPGGMLVSDDRGEHWKAERLPPGGMGSPGIEGLACPDRQACIGAGWSPPGGPAIVTSDDGGVSWRYANTGALPVELEGGGSYAAVACTGPTCVAVAQALGAGSLIAESKNAGRTWRSLLFGAGGGLTAVTCPAPGRCIVAGSIGNGAPVLALGGPGHPWSIRYEGEGTSWSSLSCPSTLHCVAAGAAAVPVAAAVMSSDDGGIEWSPGRLPAGVLGITGLTCTTVSRCLALGEVSAPRSLRQNDNPVIAVILGSTDGGVTWQRAALSSPRGTLGALSCPSAATCYAVGASPQGAGVFPEDVVVKSSDGGQHWVMQRIPPFPPQPLAGTSGSEIPGGGLTSISCFSARSCIAGGPAGVLATGDGVHWRVVERTNGPGGTGVIVDGSLENQLQLLSCASREQCLGAFTGEGKLALSTDGGRRWRPVAAPPVEVSAMTCPTSSECLVAGAASAGAVVLESFDGGRQFRRAPIPLLSPAAGGTLVRAPSYDAIACAEPTSCLAIGAGALGEIVTWHKSAAAG